MFACGSRWQPFMKSQGIDLIVDHRSCCRTSNVDCMYLPRSDCLLISSPCQCSQLLRDRVKNSSFLHEKKLSISLYCMQCRVMGGVVYRPRHLSIKNFDWAHPRGLHRVEYSCRGHTFDVGWVVQMLAAHRIFHLFILRRNGVWLSAMSWHSEAFEASANQIVEEQNCKVLILEWFFRDGAYGAWVHNTWPLRAKYVAEHSYSLGSWVSAAVMILIAYCWGVEQSVCRS